MHYVEVFISLAMAVVFPTSLLAYYCFVSMNVMHIKPPVCPMLFFLHSHSVKNVERTPSFHESSLSTRTRSWMNRTAVTRKVSSSTLICTHI